MIADAEIQQMIARQYSVQEIADIRHVPYSSLWKRIQVLGLHPVTERKWMTTGEIRQIMVLRGSGMTYAEIARVVRRSRNSIAGAVYRERKKNAAP